MSSSVCNEQSCTLTQDVASRDGIFWCPSRLMTDLGVLFNKAQKNTSCHRKCLQKAETLFAEDPDQFIDDFMCFLPRCLSVPKQEPSIERLLQFVIKFVASTTVCVERKGSEKVPFWSFFLEQTVTFTTVADKSIRCRSCQVIGDILRSLPPESEIR